MKVTIIRDEKESNERAIARFNKKVQASRKLLKIREERYWSKPKSDRYLRKAAVMREKYRSQREKNKFY